MNRTILPILLNPASGSGAGSRRREALEAALGRAGVPYRLIVTENEAHLRRETRRLAEAGGTIVGAGGDSTFAIMANEIMAAGAKVRMGMIGLGSSNDIPRELGAPGLDAACRALAGGRTRRWDVGTVAEDASIVGYFLGQANIGLGAAVNRYVAAAAARRPALARRQSLAGFLGILQSYRKKLVPLEVRVEAEGFSFSGPLTIAVFANSRFWATGKMIAPQARPDDGILDACLIGPLPIRRLVRINALAKSGRHAGRAEVRLTRAESFVLSSDTPFAVQMDGEIAGGAASPRLFPRLAFGLRRAALEVLVP